MQRRTDIIRQLEKIRSEMTKTIDQVNQFVEDPIDEIPKTLGDNQQRIHQLFYQNEVKGSVVWRHCLLSDAV